MNFLDLFAGIGGFRLGMEMAGHKCVGHVEIDKFANISYNAIHQPKEEEWSATDIRMVSDEDFRLLRGKVDCICGGFPCQAFSIAGKRGGFSDTRGTLFFEIARAAKQIQPRLLFLENVKGLLSHNKGETFATILATLDELGYDAQWQVLNSKNFGVPQNRERVFIVGYLRGTGRSEVFFVGENDQISDISERTDKTQSQTQLCTTIRTKIGSRADDTFVIQRSRGNNKGRVHDISPTLTTNSFQDNNFVIQVGNIVENKDTFGGNPQRGRVYSPDGINLHDSEKFSKPPLSGLVRTLRANKTDSAIMAVPVLTPDREEKRQNGRRFKEDGEEMFTLTAQDRHGVYDGVQIRKLTPRECWRLQGFPDWAFDKAKESGVSDSQLYKQAGNSVTVNVIYEIARRMR